MTKQPPKEEIERLISSQRSSYGWSRESIVLTIPTLQEVEAAIAAGRKTGIELRILRYSGFKSVKAFANHANVRLEVTFETIVLTHIRGLKSGPGDDFSFAGEIRHYSDDWHEHNKRIIRSYGSHGYRIIVRPGLRVPCIYEPGAFGQGTEFKSQEDAEDAREALVTA